VKYIEKFVIVFLLIFVSSEVSAAKGGGLNHGNRRIISWKSHWAPSPSSTVTVQSQSTKQTGKKVSKKKKTKTPIVVKPSTTTIEEEAFDLSEGEDKDKKAVEEEFVIVPEPKEDANISIPETVSSTKTVESQTNKDHSFTERKKVVVKE
jgi:hypothetical protein